MSKRVWGLLALISVAMGYVNAWWGSVSAQANVAIRPELAKVDWFTALLASHFEDWWFYHNPVIAFWTTLIATAVITFVIIATFIVWASN